MQFENKEINGPNREVNRTNKEMGKNKVKDTVFVISRTNNDLQILSLPALLLNKIRSSH